MNEYEQTKELKSAVRASGIAMHLARIDGRCQESAIKRAMTLHRNRMKGGTSYKIADGIVNSDNRVRDLTEILKVT